MSFANGAITGRLFWALQLLLGHTDDPFITFTAMQRLRIRPSRPERKSVLETKTRPRRKATRDQEEYKVRYDGHTFQLPWCEDHKAVQQVERNAKWVRQFIADYAPKDIVVQPVIVMPGWYVETLGNYPVKAMSDKYLINYLTTAKKRYSSEQLHPIIKRLEERCRDVEF